MSSYNRIEKIKYTKNTSEVVNLTEYIVFENERAEEKYIVFKFLNNVNQQLLGMEFEVSQYNLDGELVESSVVIYDRFLAKANEAFVPNAKLKVNYACKTVSVKLLKAAFDRFLWNEGEYADNSYKFEHYYRDSAAPAPAPIPAKKVKAEKSAKKKNKPFNLENQTRINIARFPAVFLAFVFIIVCAFVGVSLYLFRERTDKFTVDSYMLRLVSEKEVSIYGYLGNEGKLEIPSEIGGYSVVKIDSGAFTDCKMKSVTINASLTIEKHAFVNCKSLSRIYSAERITVLCSLGEICTGCAANIVMPNVTEVK